jgi:hypothetical protein
VTIQAGSQFTPEQILEAGQRAESEGRIEYALQFYRHLTDQHRGTLEARRAADALARLDPRPPPPPPGPGTNGIDYGQDYAHPSRPRPPDMGRRITIAPLDPVRQYPVDLPPPVSDYLFARRVARFATWLGAPVMLAGAASLVAGIFAPELAIEVPIVGPLQGGTGSGFGLIVTGILMIVGGQTVRAMLDTAIAARDIAAMIRVQNGGNAEHGGDADGRQQPRRRKRRF